jgi:hypothetical protein
MVAGAAACLALAVLLSLLALDVHRRDRSFQADDVLFRVGSLRDDRWQPTEIVPFGAARALLGVDDDLAYRRALQLVRRAHPRTVTYEQSKLVGRPDPARRRRTTGRQRRAALRGGEPPRRARALPRGHRRHLASDPAQQRRRRLPACCQIRSGERRRQVQPRARARHIGGVGRWRYATDVGRPHLQPGCRRRKRTRGVGVLTWRSRS